MAPGPFVQDVAVSLVAIGALAVVLRRVLGVFETRSTSPSAPAGPHTAGPSCSHCAANKTPQRS